MTTTKNETDAAWMRLALTLAARGKRTSPNPRVGCVLVRSGRVVADGWHAVFGGPHAEAVALAHAGPNARGATAYLNLEPCSHTAKKTPPCAPALIQAGVRRVVVGMLDPNPNVSGRGLRQLRAAGIAVTTGVLSEECRAINRSFIVRMTKQRPYVILKAAASLDGRMETSGGESKWITSPEARAEARRLRGTVDAILAGVGTVLSDDPELTAHGFGPDPLRVILDSRLHTPPSAKVLYGTASTLIATSRRDVSAFSNKLARLAGNSPASARPAIIQVPGRAKSGVNLKELLTLLYKLGINSLLVEGGSAVHTSFLEQHLVDEIHMFVAPKLLGGAKARGFFEGTGIRRLADAINVSQLTAKRVGPDWLFTGYLN